MELLEQWCAGMETPLRLMRSGVFRPALHSARTCDGLEGTAVPSRGLAAMELVTGWEVASLPGCDVHSAHGR